MKAVIISSPGAPSVLKITERPTPVPAQDKVLIEVRAAGVNRPDVAQRQGHYPAPPGVSAEIPGLEVAGTIVACGATVKRDGVCSMAQCLSSASPPSNWQKVSAPGWW